MKGKDLMKGVGQSVGNASKASLPNGEKLSEKVNQNKNKFAQASRDASNASKSKNNGEVDEENQEELGQDPKGKTKTGLPDTQGLGTAAAKEALKTAAGVVPYTKWIPKAIRDKIIDKFMDSKLGQAMVEREIKKTKTMLIITICTTVASLLFYLFLMCAIFTLIFAPIAWINDALSGIGDFFASLGNWFGGNGWCSSNAECQQNNESIYYEKLTKAINDYKGTCPINEDLITATIFYGQMVDTNQDLKDDGTYYDYTDVTESNLSSPTAHSKINGLIKVYATGEEETQDEIESGTINIGEQCEQSAEKYRKYLINTYIPNHYPSAVTSGRTKENIADEILAMGNIVIGGDSSSSSSGIVVSGGQAGSIPLEVLQNMANPVGSQKLRHTSCFGYYNYKCAPHNGIDIGGSDDFDPIIYAVADGVVTYVQNVNSNCYPNLDVDNVCGHCTISGAGNAVTVRHTLNINGKTYEFSSRYLHMKSFNVKKGDTVKKGQQIGVMGNTGCSSGEHLHFEMYDTANKRYNPEEVLKYFNSHMISNCEDIRQACYGR